MYLIHFVTYIYRVLFFSQGPQDSFSKCSCFCKVANVTLYSQWEDCPRNSAYFVWRTLSTCAQTQWLKFHAFNGCGIEPFALARRIKSQQDSARLGQFEVTMLEDRVSLKHLVAIINKLPNPQNFRFADTYSRKIQRMFEPSEIQHCDYISGKIE